MQNPLTAPGDIGAQALLEKAEPDLATKTSDLIPKANRRIMRSLTNGKYTPALEIESRPDSLKRETRQKERHDRVLRAVQLRSID